MSERATFASQFPCSTAAGLLKIPRENIGLLCIEAEHCPYVLPRILGTLACHGFTAFTIMVRRERRAQFIEMELGLPPSGAGTRLLREFRRIRMVRHAHLECLLDQATQELN